MVARTQSTNFHLFLSAEVVVHASSVGCLLFQLPVDGFFIAVSLRCSAVCSNLLHCSSRLSVFSFPSISTCFGHQIRSGVILLTLYSLMCDIACSSRCTWGNSSCRAVLFELLRRVSQWWLPTIWAGNSLGISVALCWGPLNRPDMTKYRPRLVLQFQVYRHQPRLRLPQRPFCCFQLLIHLCMLILQFALSLRSWRGLGVSGHPVELSSLCPFFVLHVALSQGFLSPGKRGCLNLDSKDVLPRSRNFTSPTLLSGLLLYSLFVHVPSGICICQPKRFVECDYRLLSGDRMIGTGLCFFLYFLDRGGF